MSLPEKDRNEEALALHLLNKKKYTAAVLARKYGLTRQTMHVILLREMARKGHKKALTMKTIKTKYPKLLE